MWKSLLYWARQQFVMGQKLDKVEADVEELRQELRDVMVVLRELAYEVRYDRETQNHEREKTMLRLENELLKFERRLPQARNNDDNDN